MDDGYRSMKRTVEQAKGHRVIAPREEEYYLPYNHMLLLLLPPPKPPPLPQ
jgi:hypothetical protein